MRYKIYKTPDPDKRLDTSQPYNGTISDLLLTFDETAHLRQEIHRVVTTLAPITSPRRYRVVACQCYQRREGNVSYLLVPERDRMYFFREEVIPIQDLEKRFLKAGFKGLIFGAKEKGVVCKSVSERDSAWHLFTEKNVSEDDWYHFTGTAENILEELQKKCALTLR